MKLFEKDELKLLWLFYLESFVSSLLFFAPAFFIIYFIGLGFSFFKISLIMAAPQLASIIFEIPTGAFADNYGRKYSVIISNILVALCFFAMIFFTDFTSILIIFFLFGLAITFGSGAFEAWVVDLINKDNKKLLNNFFVKNQSIHSASLFISGFLGVFMVAKFGLSIIWSTAVVTFVISAIILLFGKEEFSKKNYPLSKSYKNIKKQTKKSLKYTYNHKTLFYFILAGMIYVIADSLGGQAAWIPFLDGLGFPDYAFGYLWSLIGFISIIATISSQYFYKKNKEINYIVKASIIVSIILLPLFFINSVIWALVVFSIMMFFEISKGPALKVYFHRFIPKNMRATIGSTESMIYSLAGVISLPLTGYLIDTIGARYTIILSAFVAIPSIIIYSLINNKLK